MNTNFRFFIKSVKMAENISQKMENFTFLDTLAVSFWEDGQIAYSYSGFSPGYFRWGVRFSFFDPPSDTPPWGVKWGVSLKSHKIYLRRVGAREIFNPHLKIWSHYGFSNAYFPFSYPFYWFFMFIFSIFVYIRKFSWGVRPPWPPTFFQMGGQNFFHGGSGSWNGGSEFFDPPGGRPWGSAECPHKGGGVKNPRKSVHVVYEQSLKF